MKPISVRFRCFGPYMQEQFIDFQELGKNGLFLICGETGSGKTTILDAMCYALYGRSSGGLRGDLSVMRCKLAGKEDDTLVEFIFDSGRNRYKFTRGLRYGRKNLLDSHNCLILRDGEYVPVFENPKATNVNQKAQALIGLTYDQFRQVILLPQGQFEKLLVSDSAEKEKILVSLFRADRWQRIAEELYRRVMEQDSVLKQEKLLLEGILRSYGAETAEALEEKCREKEAQLRQLREQAAAAEAENTASKKQYEAALLLGQAFRELERQEQLLAQLRSRSPEFHREARLLEKAAVAVRLQPGHRALQEARQRQQRSAEQCRRGEAALERAGAVLAREEARRDSHAQRQPEYARQQAQLTLLENALPVYQSLTQKQQAVARAEKEQKRASQHYARAEAGFADSDGAWQRVVTEQSGLMEQYRRAQAGYLQSIGSVLAEKLTPGRPCPVCGSLEHPQPAAAAGARVTEAELDELNRRMNQANDRVRQAMEARREAEGLREQAAQQQNTAGQLLAVARTDYENALSRKIAGVETEAQLTVQCARLREALAAFQKEEEAIAQGLKAAESAEKVAQAALAAAREEAVLAEHAVQAQSASWQAGLEAAGLGDEAQFLAASLEPGEMQRRQEALIRFRAELEQAQKDRDARSAALEGQQPPELGALKEEREALELQLKTLSGQCLLAEKNIQAMRTDLEGLIRRSEKYGKSRASVDANLDFANRLRGRSGVSLQRYVLGVMLTSITLEANRLLSGVYGGRYQLYRTDEIAGSGHKGGLELEVYDSHNSQRRSVTTLSGGEKFLVALSLAIGLSTVVQAQGSGIRLEAMFVDEGFGSLDREAVTDALEVLQGIQRSAGVVGIISHVEYLEETIPTRLEVTKGRNGSACRIRS